jgi:hypothetical protein
LSRSAYPCPPISGSRREDPGGAASRCRQEGPGGRGPQQGSADDRPNLPAPHVPAWPGLVAHAELGTGESVGSSPREVNILKWIRAGTKYALFLAEIWRFSRPETAIAHDRSQSRSRLRTRGIYGWRRCVRRPKVTAAARTHPELIRLPRGAWRRIAHLHVRTAALTTHLELVHALILTVHPGL